MVAAFDPYGEQEYGDWEDPYNHIFLTMCTGCSMCVAWEGKPYDQIRSERRALVSRRRLASNPEQPISEVGREDCDYWTQRYAG